MKEWTSYSTASAITSCIFLFQQIWFYFYLLSNNFDLGNEKTSTDTFLIYELKIRELICYNKNKKEKNELNDIDLVKEPLIKVLKENDE